MNVVTTETRRIPACNLPRLQAEVETLNRRAVRLKLEPMTVTVHRTETVVRKHELTGVEWRQEYAYVSISGESPIINGWSLLARKTPVETIDAQGNEQVEYLIAAVPGCNVPPEYRTNGLHCDHCGTARWRKDVFLLRHQDGRTKQVGRQCIGDFLGHIAPDAILGAAEWLSDGSGLLEDADNEGWGGMGRREREVDIGLFLAVAAVCMRKLGWVSGQTAYNAAQEGRSVTSTASEAWAVLTNHTKEQQEYVRKMNLYAEEKDGVQADLALAWARTLQTQENDYLTTLGVCCRRPVVDLKSKAWVASALMAHTRFLESEEEKRQRELDKATRDALEASRPPLKHVGEVGVRQGFPGLTVKFTRFLESQFGVRTVVSFEDADGNNLVWFASGEQEYEKGEKLDVTATVKEHGEYKGKPQTVLQRVVEGLPQPKGKKKAKPTSVLSADGKSRTLANGLVLTTGFHTNKGYYNAEKDWFKWESVAKATPRAKTEYADDKPRQVRTLANGTKLIDGQEYDLTNGAILDTPSEVQHALDCPDVAKYGRYIYWLDAFALEPGEERGGAVQRQDTIFAGEEAAAA